ncbi:MAG: hypothetical protein IPK19_30590 [Chloroflexi bacterium]|nr:hypothetical protein [Chloroflexota bacterium]
MSPSAVTEWTAGIVALLSDTRAVALTALADDQSYAGYVVGWEPPVGLLPAVGSRVGLIGDLVIDMHRYRGGVARALVAALRAQFAARGVNRLVALSARRHVTGQAFWRSVGGVEWMDGFWLK